MATLGNKALQAPLTYIKVYLGTRSGGSTNSFNSSEDTFALRDATSDGGNLVELGSAENIEIILGGVRQQPQTDYTISGSEVTFIPAPTTGTNFFGIRQAQVQEIVGVGDGTIGTPKLVDGAITVAKTVLASSGDATTGTSNIVLSSPGRVEEQIVGKTHSMVSGKGFDFSADSKGVFKGLSSIVWRMITNETAGDHTPIGGAGSDWAISDDTENEFYLGSATQVTEASGIFSFSSTGYWSAKAYGLATATSAEPFISLNIISTIDDFTSETIVATGITSLYSSSSQSSTSTEALLKVSNIANDKIKLSQSSNSNQGKFEGRATNNFTYIVFTKLADL